MKKTKLTRSLLAACSIVALTAVMYGCIHGGDDDPAPASETPMPMPEPEPAPEPEPEPAPEPEPEPEPEPMEPTPETVTLPRALGMYLDAADMPMAGVTTIMAGMSDTNNAVVFSCAAGGDDCVVTVDANGMVTATGGMVTATLTAEAMERAEEAEMMAMRDMRDRVIGKDRALEAASNIDQAATPTAGTLHEDNIMITRGAGKMASVKVTDPGGYLPSDTPAMSNGSWAGTRLMRPVAGATQHLVVYTDIEAPTRVQFYDFDRDANTPARYTDASAPTHTNPYGPGDTLTPLDLSDGTTSLNSMGTLDPKFGSPGSAEDGNVTQRFPVASGQTTTSFQGNFNGAAGTYTCTVDTAGDTCVVTIAPNGTYSETEGAWTFTPELNATAWQQDSEFMSFGWWLQEPTSPNGAYTFQYYADGNPYVVPAGTITPGSATYSGRAAGQYAVQTIGDGGVTGGMHGEFTAAASLTANFGPTNTISGTISGFQGDGAMSDWMVTLHEKSLGAQTNLATVFPAATNTDPASTVNPFDGATATMGSQTAHGDWTGQFFGGNSPTNVNEYPLGVGGTFQADNEQVSIAGAFGARRPTE